MNSRITSIIVAMFFKTSINITTCLAYILFAINFISNYINMSLNQFNPPLFIIWLRGRDLNSNIGI